MQNLPRQTQPAFKFPDKWPRAADANAGLRLRERFAPFDPHGAVPQRLLSCLGGNAPYLADLVIHETDTLLHIVELGPDTVVAQAMAKLAGTSPAASRDKIAAATRQAKRIVALSVAVADIGRIWPLERVTLALSDLADACLGLSVAYLLRTAHEAGHLTLPRPDDPAHGSGFTVLGMGKLGARELNYSSDVDLVLLYDPEAGVYQGDVVGAFFTRLARDMVALMEARDANGYVFRTDLRLRPDPAATAPCIALPAAIAYYESMGQNWERAAMLKARVVAGDPATANVFLTAIRPFIWRKHLDFAAVADIHAVKRRIDVHRKTALTEHGNAVSRILGHNVKLGQGGIREIEFLAQTLQLVWGGRDPGLRAPATLDALRLLVRGGHLPQQSATDLAAAYRFLRQVEHRLQMVADRQTHSLPETEEQLAAFAVFMGYRDATSFAAALLRHLEHVQKRYHEVFEHVPDVAEQSLVALDFTGIGDEPQTLAALKSMGYINPASVVATVQGWTSGRVRALRSDRARELMVHLLPALLHGFARQRQPDAAFGRFDLFLSRLPAGVQLLSLFHRNPRLLDRIAAVLGAAPSLADHLTRTPSALEGLLTPEDQQDYPRTLRGRLADTRLLEDAIAVIRRTVREEDFAISVGTLDGRMDADTAGLRRTELADAAIGALLPRVLADFSERFGHVRGGRLCVVLLGKAGGKEMMAGSDLDLMLIYDHPATVTESTGARPVATSQWYIRAVHAFIAALTAPDAAGPLYAVDMRLRPSGNKGPVAVSMQAFQHYHAPAHSGDVAGGSAWTWERMALTRARVVAGPLALRRRIEMAIQNALRSAGPPDRILADAVAMRARLLRDLPSKGAWDVKHRVGGQIEVEFVAQALQLVHPAAASPTTRVALANLAHAGALPVADAIMLIEADRTWRTVQGMLRLTEGMPTSQTLSDASSEALIRAANSAGLAVIDVPQLYATLERIAQSAREAFIRNIGAIDA